MKLINKWLLYIFAGFLTVKAKVAFAQQEGVFSPERGLSGTGLTATPVIEILITLMNWLLQILPLVAVIGFIVSGLLFILSAGNPERATTAKSFFVYSIVGTIVALSGYIVLNLISSILEGNVQM